MYGPEPIAWVFASYFASLSNTSPGRPVSTHSRFAYGALSLSSTVFGSLALTETKLTSESASWYCFVTSSLMDHATSSASSLSPFENVMPSLRWNVYVVPSSLTSHVFAMAGTT